MGALHGGLAVGIVGERDLSHPGLAGTARRVKQLPEFALRFGGDHHVGALTGQRTRFGPGDGDPDRNAPGRQVPQPGLLDVEVLAPEVDARLAVEQTADDLGGFREHRMPDADSGPALADDVLVEVLAGAEAEAEPVAREDPQRRRLLGDDRRVIPDRRDKSRRSSGRSVRSPGQPPRGSPMRSRHGPARPATADSDLSRPRSRSRPPPPPPRRPRVGRDGTARSSS